MAATLVHTLTDDDICQRFMIVMNQRGGITLDGFLRVLGYHKSPSSRNWSQELLTSIDQLCTEMLPSPDCRVVGPRMVNGVESGEMIRYLKSPPEKPFAPPRLSTVKVTRAPELATWTPEVAAQRKQEDRQRRSAFYGKGATSPSSPTDLRRHVAALTLPQSPFQGKGGQESSKVPTTQTASKTTNTQEGKTVANGNSDRSQGADERLDAVLTQLKQSWPLNRLSLSHICREGKFSSGFFAMSRTKGPERKQRALAAIEERRAALTPGPSLKTERGGSEPVEQEGRSVKDLEAQARVLTEENRELRSQLRELQQQQGNPQADPREVLAVKAEQLDRQIETLNDQHEDLLRQREALWQLRDGIGECLKLLEVA
ncbi:MAG: hypothetical protein AAF609_22835 [Cyanobacteria bacterium P01_C01_bin.120]